MPIFWRGVLAFEAGPDDPAAGVRGELDVVPTGAPNGSVRKRDAVVGAEDAVLPNR